MHVCNVCGWVYEESKGLPGYGIEPGTKWEDLPKISVAPFAPLKKMCLWKYKEQAAAAACFP